MARSEDVLSLFLASPGDVQEERNRLAEVVANWNRTWSRHLDVRLELLRWEDDAYPNIGDDAQDVINRQMPSDWDIFVGIMWSRFGTPTGRAGSGTHEEFERAMERHRAAPGSISVLFYFKEAPISPSKIDTAQLHQVQAFKAHLKSSGLLVWDFENPDQFGQLAELHITRHVQEWRLNRAQGSGTSLARPSPTSAKNSSADVPLIASQEAESKDDDDAGYLDLLESLKTHSEEMQDIVLRLTQAQNELADQTTKGREELDRLTSNPSQLSPKKFRATIAHVADEMLRYTARVDKDVPLLHSSVDALIGALTRLATVSADLYPEQVTETKSAAVTLLQNMVSARQSTEAFRDSTAGLPRMTKELNVAKRKQVAVLGELVAEFQNAERLLAEAVSVIDGLTAHREH